MNVTLTLEDQLVQKAEKIAAQRDTTLTGLISSQFESLFAHDDAAMQRPCGSGISGLLKRALKNTISLVVSGRGNAKIFMTGPDFLDANILVYA